MECGGLVSWSIQEFSWLMRGVLSRDVSWAHLVSLPHLTFFLCRSGIQLWDTTATTATSPVHKKLLAFTSQTRFSPLVSSKGCSGLRCVSISLCSISSDDSLHRCSDIHSSAPTLGTAYFQYALLGWGAVILAAYDCLLVWSQSSFGCFPTLKVILSPVLAAVRTSAESLRTSAEVVLQFIWCTYNKCIWTEYVFRTLKLKSNIDEVPQGWGRSSCMQTRAYVKFSPWLPVCSRLISGLWASQPSSWRKVSHPTQSCTPWRFYSSSQRTTRPHWRATTANRSRSLLRPVSTKSPVL